LTTLHRFVERLGPVLEQTAAPCYAWALIPNHFRFEDVVSKVCGVFTLTCREVLSWSKQRKRSIARSVLAYWSVKELGMTACAVAEKLGLSPSAASRCVQRGERIVAKDRMVL
jgi:hypothetical protein